MKEGFLFGLGFSLVYFATQYLSATLVYFLQHWEYRRKLRTAIDSTVRERQHVKQMDPPRWRDYN